MGLDTAFRPYHILQVLTMIQIDKHVQGQNNNYLFEGNSRLSSKYLKIKAKIETQYSTTDTRETN